MILSEPERWQLRILPDKYMIQGHRTFSGIATSRFPKIYVFCDQDGPVYVGITKRSMSQRLAYGFKASGKGGYYGYAFRRPNGSRNTREG